METPNRSPVPGQINEQKGPKAGNETVRVPPKAAPLTCKDCRYCYGKGTDMHCRRYPPVVYYDSAEGSPDVKFPGVLPDWCCGEGRL